MSDNIEYRMIAKPVNFNTFRVSVYIHIDDNNYKHASYRRSLVSGFLCVLIRCQGGDTVFHYKFTTPI